MGGAEKRSLDSEAVRYNGGVKIRDVIKMVESDGWIKIGQEGSHRQYKHPIKSGKVTIAGHPSVDMPPGTLKNILRQAQIQEKR